MSDPSNGSDLRRQLALERDRPTSPRPLRGLLGFLIGIGIVVGLVAGNEIMMKQVGHALARNWEQRDTYPAAGASLAKMQDPGDSTKTVDRICRSRSASIALPRALADRLDMAPDVVVGEERLLQHAAYIDCLAKERPNRFCAGARDRAHLVASVNDYYTLKKSVREERAFGSANRLAMAAALDPGVRSGGPFPSERTDPAIATALATLVRRGYVAKAEFGRYFGLVMPGDLGEILRDVKRENAGCA